MTANKQVLLQTNERLHCFFQLAHLQIPLLSLYLILTLEQVIKKLRYHIHLHDFILYKVVVGCSILNSTLNLNSFFFVHFGFLFILI